MELIAPEAESKVTGTLKQRHQASAGTVVIRGEVTNGSATPSRPTPADDSHVVVLVRSLT